MSAIVLLLHHEKEKKNVRAKKRYWSKKWFLNRENFSDMRWLSELRENNPDDYRNYLRMNDECFDYLLAKVEPLIKKENTRMRNAISAEQRLVVTLRFLATGRSLEDLKFSLGISPQRLGVIIPETCRAIITTLKQEYVMFPKEKEEWLQIADAFKDAWNFPNCGGCIDGKHVRIVAPHDMGSYFYNYKGYHSIVLMAIANANYEFIMLDVGANGRISDGGVIENTIFFRKLLNNELNLPTNNETKCGLNFVFVADDAFALHDHILKPFPRKVLNSDEKKIFNYRVSRARRCVENAFGILASRCRIFHTAINMSLWKINLAVMACCVQHNFLRRKARHNYMPPGSVDVEDIHTGAIIPGEWRNDDTAFYGLQNAQQNHSKNAKENRIKYLQYFNGVGAVSWQNDMI